MDDGVVADSRRVTPLSNPRLVDSAMEAIRGAILAGRFAPGERLLEMQLAMELGIWAMRVALPGLPVRDW